MGCCHGKNSFGFGYNTTAVEVSEGIDLAGQVALVTGANVGIGYETARVLALRGASVVLACRSEAKCAAAIAKIQRKQPGAMLSGAVLDLARLESVRSFAREFMADHESLHLLILNSGCMLVDHELTDDGFELHMATNHMGHAYLAVLLEPLLLRARPAARAVVLASVAHEQVYGFDVHHLHELDSASYSSWNAYCKSKLANVLFARHWARRVRGTGLVVTSVHPGVIATKLTRNSCLARCGWCVARPWLKSIAQGAATTVFAAASPHAADMSGRYLADCGPASESYLGRNDELAQQLWIETMHQIRAVTHDERVPLDEDTSPHAPDAAGGPASSSSTFCSSLTTSSSG